MAINTILSFLVPKENKFFPLINNIGFVLNNAGKALIEFINADKEQMDGLYVKIKSYEKEADGLVDTVFVELNNTFLTPFDREDIQLLCERLDDTLDSINSSSKRVLLFMPNYIPEAAIEICNIISASCEAIYIALKELKTIGKKSDLALGQCDKLHALEHDADDLYEEYMKHLFENEHDSVELLKLKEIMQELERTTDITHSVGKIIKTIIVKYT
ncbi:MAG: DUF47 family protein [Spirochaetia bacterium]|jgi:predicted phosphate transport protein (TIGR00153 family)|nr:DUF47 family protein [Spirochaetia bacterium]